MLLQDIYAVPSVRPVEMITKSTPGAGRPWASWEGALEISSGIGEADLIHLWEVLVLAHQEPVPVDIRICSVYSLVMSFHVS